MTRDDIWGVLFAIGTTLLVALVGVVFWFGMKQVSKGPAHLSNDQIITETKKCEAAGLKAAVITNLWDSSTAAIKCEPKELPHD